MSITCFLALVAPLGAVAAPAETPLLPLDTVDGVRQTYEPNVPLKIEVVTGKENSTDGSGGLRFGGAAATGEGNHYLGVTIALKEPVDLRGRRVLLDARTTLPADTRAFYVRFYNRGEAKPAWSFNSWDGQLGPTWRTFSFQQGLCPEGLAWEPDVVETRVADRVDRVELIIGTSRAGGEIDMLAGNLRTAERVQTLQDLGQPKPLLRETVLVRDGQPAAVVLHPDTPAGRDAAQAVVDSVGERTGVTLPARPATAADREPGQTALLLGSVDSNPALLLLYARYLTPVDSVCPGAGGCLVHTVHDPFGKGCNTVVLGAADDAGLKRAGETFRGLVAGAPKGATLTLPRLFERGYSPDFLKRFPWAGAAPSPGRLEEGMAEGRRVLDEGRHTSIAGVLARVADRYRLTGESVEAKLFVALWDLYAQSAVADPRKFGGPWGFDSDFPSAEVVSGWDAIEEDPALTDAERLRVTKTMARWLAEAVIPKVGTSAGHVPHNHQTFPGLGALMAGLYFSQGYNVAEGPQWLAVADGLFRPQAARFKPMEDCNGYQWLTNGHQMRYALARPDAAIFDGGSARKITDYCLGTMDNLGYQVPYGDTGSWQCWTSEVFCLDAFAFATGDAAATWASNLKRRARNLCELYAFTRAGEGALPDGTNGVKVWPLEPKYYDTFPAEGRPPLERCFDKVSFREAMDPEAAYLLLDGLSNGGHKHVDGNSMPRLTQFGRIWLADNDYIKAQAKYHNTALVFKDGGASAVPDYVELLGAGESGRYGYSRTRALGYSGVDWDRSVIWLKERKAFVVLDRMTAREAGEYQFRVLWHGVGAAATKPDGMLLRQKGPSLWVQVAPGPRVRVVDDTELGSNWGGYPHADPVVHSLTATATAKLPARQSYLFATVLHGTPQGDAKPWQIAFLEGEDGVLVKTDRGSFAVRLDAGGPVVGGKLRTDAQLTVSDAAGVSLLGARRAGIGAEEVHRSDTPACLDLPVPEAAAALAGLRTRPATPNLPVGGTAPAHPIVWTRRPQPERLLLTGNRGVAGSLNLGVKLHSTPRPAKANVFDASSPNTLDALRDGPEGINTTNSVMFEPDRTVTLTVDLGAPCLLQRVRWLQWWSTTSSKQTAYLLEQAVVEASSDGFRADRRPLGTVADPGPHPNFGTPIEYGVDGKGVKARHVRLTIRPKPGSAVYLAEVLVEGRPAGKSAGPPYPPEPGGAGYTFTHLAAARLGRQGPTGLYAATAQGTLLALNPDGTPRWSASFRAAVNDVAAADLDGDRRDEAVVGRADHFVTALDDDGRELWSKELPYYREPAAVAVIRTGDIDGDGKPEVIAGADNWRFYAFRADGTELWNYESVHKSSSGAVADLDGDGKDEVLCGTIYYSTPTLKGDGTRLWEYGLGPICHDIATGSFDGNRTRGAVYGGGDGFVHYVGPDGKPRMRFQTGEEVRHVATADLDGDGRDEILAGSQNNNVYCFGADGKLRWRKDLGSAVSALAAAGRVAVAGTDAGGVYSFGKAGKLLAVSDVKARVIELKPHDGGIVAATADGRLRQLRARP